MIRIYNNRYTINDFLNLGIYYIDFRNYINLKLSDTKLYNNTYVYVNEKSQMIISSSNSYKNSGLGRNLNLSINLTNLNDIFETGYNLTNNILVIDNSEKINRILNEILERIKFVLSKEENNKSAISFFDEY